MFGQGKTTIDVAKVAASSAIRRKSMNVQATYIFSFVFAWKQT